MLIILNSLKVTGEALLYDSSDPHSAHQDKFKLLISKNYNVNGPMRVIKPNPSWTTRLACVGVDCEGAYIMGV